MADGDQEPAPGGAGSGMCAGSATQPASIHESVGQVAAKWGDCPDCHGSFRVGRDGLLVEHRPRR
jgi:hypothetical protein